MTMIVKVYTQTLNLSTENKEDLIITKSETNTEWSDYFLTILGTEKNFKEENDSEIDKLDHHVSSCQNIASFSIFFDLKLHSFIIGITHLFANIKASHCSGLYIIHQAIII